MKAVQKFTPEYLQECSKMTPEQIARFLESFRLIHGVRGKPPRSKLISMKVPLPLLNAFKEGCRLLGVPYQSQIKKLMQEWLSLK